MRASITVDNVLLVFYLMFLFYFYLFIELVFWFMFFSVIGLQVFIILVIITLCLYWFKISLFAEYLIKSYVNVDVGI